MGHTTVSIKRRGKVIHSKWIRCPITAAMDRINQEVEFFSVDSVVLYAHTYTNILLHAEERPRPRPRRCVVNAVFFLLIQCDQIKTMRIFYLLSIGWSSMSCGTCKKFQFDRENRLATEMVRSRWLFSHRIRIHTHTIDSFLPALTGMAISRTKLCAMPSSVGGTFGN